jgi:hypothetical protein
VNTTRFTPERSEAIRAELQRRVNAIDPLPHRPHRKLAGLAIFAVAGIVSGGAVAATATSNLFWPNTSADPLPGAQTATALTDVVISEGSGSVVIELPGRPTDATHLSVVFTCRTAGTFGWGLDASGMNSNIVCEPGEMSSYNFPISNRTENFYVTTTDPDASWSIASRFVQTRTEALGVNENGETYGIEGDGGTPDLIAVTGRADDGTFVSGYVRASDMEQPMPTSPEEAIRMQEEYRAKYPNGRDIPVYKSDGKTRIGTFTIG